MSSYCQFKDLNNQILRSVSGFASGSSCIVFVTLDGKRYEMQHYQDCCESVELMDVDGDIDDLLYTPIIDAYETTEIGSDDASESYTWTFYHIQTAKGSIMLRWFGESNGYYSESVDFERKSDVDELL